MNMNYSVLMSVYDKEKPEYLKQSIESMLNQTVKPEQFVIVEDGPLNKELKNIISDYNKKNYEMFTVIKLRENGGLGNALNIGIDACRNELIARMDSDDISLPERCEKQLKRFEKNSNLAIVGSNIDEFWDNPEEIKNSRVVPSDYKTIKKKIGRIQPFNHPTVMYRKSEVVRCGKYELMEKNDRELFSRMIFMGCIAENINESLLLYRSNKDNYKRRKSWKYCKSTIDVSVQIWKRKHCTFGDLMYVITGQLLLFVLPLPLMKAVSDKLLRKKK